ncbi:hypothetical protein U3A55_12475 [Salarchaeum sp. III]|uniref:hypothetical protein n=1 Tax=Salarchaeum sp. III TaxID=3107927 RepID=UPI002EDA32C9
MGSLWRLLSAWFAFSLSVGAGTQAVVRAALGRGSVSNPVLAGSVVTLATAVVFCRRYPVVDVNAVWWFSGLTFVLFVAGNAVAPNGFYADSGEQSLAVIVVLWCAAAALAYGLTKRRRQED